MNEIDTLRARVHELETLINTPHTVNFLEAVKIETAHQVERWGTAHDRAKAPADWFWLVGYLSGKALQAAIIGDREKALHHTISTAAALANWHVAIKGPIALERALHKHFKRNRLSGEWFKATKRFVEVITSIIEVENAAVGKP